MKVHSLKQLIDIPGDQTISSHPDIFSENQQHNHPSSTEKSETSPRNPKENLSKHPLNTQKRSDGNEQQDKKLIIVSNRLPVTIRETLKKSSGGLVSAMESIMQDMELNWIGWPGQSLESEEEKERWSKRLLKEYQYTPVHLSQSQVEAYYDGYANSCLWPTFHYIPNYLERNEAWWENYKEVNQIFAQTIIDTAQPGDVVWIHDYHLMLVPKILREKRPDLSIGFFLHTPFPSFEVFRCIPERKELLEGLLGADLIGFHTSGYLRHFQSCLLRLLSLESQCSGLRYGDRDISMGVFPIGIHAEQFIKTCKEESFTTCKKNIQNNYPDKKIILNVERLDYTKGLPSRLQAIDSYLDQCDEQEKSSLAFVFVAVPSRGDVEKYQELREEIEGWVGHINGRHATVNNSPIHFIYNSITMNELCALYTLADVMMVTPYIDGMNLVAKEYAACQEEGDGVLILSEFAGAAEELYSALKVNPYDIHSMTESLKIALHMPKKEKKERMFHMRERVLDFDATYWANQFMGSLASLEQQEITTHPFNEVLTQSKAHLGKSPNSAIFLDYDGTLRGFKDNPDQAFPDPELENILDQLERDYDGMVFITSGRSAHDLKLWLGHRMIHLIAEHGYLMRKPGEEFIPLSSHIDMSWKAVAKDLLRHYVGTTPGSYVEEKQFSLVWHYRLADPVFGSWRAQQAVAELADMTSNMPVSVCHGHKIVEISSIHVNKGVAMQQMMDMYNIDNLLCAGDDTTDETMFKIDDPRVMSIKVGEGPTLAQHRLQNVTAMRRFLKGVCS